MSSEKPNWNATGAFAELTDKMLKAGKLLSTIKDEDVDVGATPKTLVMRRDKVELFRYEPLAAQKVKTPWLLAYGLTGRYLWWLARRVHELGLLADDAVAIIDQVQRRSDRRHRRRSQADELPAHGEVARRPAGPSRRGGQAVAEGSLPRQQAGEGRIHA